MKNIIQHVKINNGDELIVLNGTLVFATEEGDLSEAAANLKMATSGMLVEEELETPKDDDWNNDDVLELLPSHLGYVGKNQYSVIGVHEENWQIVCHDIFSKNMEKAMEEIQEVVDGMTVVAVLKGEFREGKNIIFPSENVVD